MLASYAARWASIVAALLALLYLYSGALKVLRSPDQLRPMMGWIDAVPLRLVRTIGMLEVLGALGLTLPPLTGLAPALTLAVATGLVLNPRCCPRSSLQRPFIRMPAAPMGTPSLGGRRPKLTLRH